MALKLKAARLLLLLLDRVCCLVKEKPAQRRVFLCPAICKTEQRQHVLCSAGSLGDYIIDAVAVAVSGRLLAASLLFVVPVLHGA